MSMSKTILTREFYLRPTLEAAPELIGKFLIFKPDQNMTMSVRIVEVEAYIGVDDPACHACRGKTDRNAVMFGPGGFSYLYFIYGMYHCLNFVTEKDGFPAAVLIRAGEPVEGIEEMYQRYPKPGQNKLTNGPGKLCKALGLTRKHNNLDLTGSRLYLEDRGYTPDEIVAAPRIGIKRAVNRNWRFYDKNSQYVSVK